MVPWAGPLGMRERIRAVVQVRRALRPGGRQASHRYWRSRSWPRTMLDSLDVTARTKAMKLRLRAGFLADAGERRRM